MVKPLFSIITVTFNPGEGLARTVESIKIQGYGDYEHIIKDAGSIDGSIEQYAQPSKDYSPIVICKPDKGIYDAMNQALDYATGGYVLFLNAGDCLYDENVLERIEKRIKQKPDCDFIYGDYYSDKLGILVKSPNRLNNYLLYRTTLCHQSCIVKRQLIDKLGRFDTSLIVLADYDLLLRLIKGANVLFLYQEITVSSCMGGGFSTQSTNARIALREAVILRRRHFKLIERLQYSFLRALTLPWLRIKLMQSMRFVSLQKVYIRAINILHS